MTTNTRNEAAEIDRAEEQAKSQLESIREMLAAVAVDYDRLEELREAREALREEFDAMPENAGIDFDRWVCDMAGSAWSREEQDELDALEAAAGDGTDEDDARQRIQEDPLSVQIRSGWYSPGETPEPEEFEILLCTGGPAVRIIGELNEYKEPSRAWLEYQDWGTSWQSYYEAGANDVLIEYAQHFYFGE